MSKVSNKSISAHLQRSLFFALCFGIILVCSLCFADWLYRTGMSPAKWTLVGLYVILTSGLAFGFSQVFFGFIQVLRGKSRLKITERISSENLDIPKEIHSKVALLFPIYNEDPKRFYNNIATVYRALEKTGFIAHFDFFILSDSTDSNRWIEEEKLWLEFTNKLNAQGRITYRHRTSNINQKSGNVSDFCRRWGSLFDHMICFDADSLMSAQSILKLVHLIERNPQIGIIQTMPGLFGAETLFSRLQQFANRIHGQISGAGLNFWQQSEGNYWGHNAIIRLKPFIESCALPELPGPKPLGGRVLSHDFVEAALMRKAGYEVWLAYDIGDSFEELPPTLLDFAQRDRRWCQGNLQHAWIAFFGKVPFINRVHMLNGIYAYLAAPIWLLFLVISTLSAYSWQQSGLTLLARDPNFPLSPDSLNQHGLVILGMTLGLIFVPKLLTICALLIDQDFRRRFGGGVKAITSIGIEVFVFSLMAPILMLFHSVFVFSILTGNKVKWTSQNRGATTHTTWAQSTRAHYGQTLVGLVWSLFAWQINPTLFYWMSPLFLGWIIAIPLSVITSHTDGAKWLKSKGFLLTPEEIAPPDIIKELNSNLSTLEEELIPIDTLKNDFGMIQVALDPYFNALHLEFLPSRRNQSEETKQSLKQLEDRLINEGAPKLNASDKGRILNDRNSVRSLHHRLWTQPEAQMNPWWRLAISRYSRQSFFKADSP